MIQIMNETSEPKPYNRPELSKEAKKFRAIVMDFIIAHNIPNKVIIDALCSITYDTRRIMERGN